MQNSKQSLFYATLSNGAFLVWWFPKFRKITNSTNLKYLWGVSYAPTVGLLPLTEPICTKHVDCANEVPSHPVLPYARASSFACSFALTALSVQNCTIIMYIQIDRFQIKVTSSLVYFECQSLFHREIRHKKQ